MDLRAGAELTMADILDVTVIIKRNGRDVAGFPYQKRMVVDEL